MTVVHGGFRTRLDPGLHPLGSPVAAGLDPRKGRGLAGDGRWVGVEARLLGEAWEILRLGDPMLEAEAMRLQEADAAGVTPGQLMFARVLVGPEGIREGAFACADRARAFLEGEADMNDHWAGFLDAAPDQDGFPPVLLVRGDGIEVMDGLHRLAGHAVHGTPEVAVVVGVAPGRSIAEIPGAILDAPDAPEREPEPKGPQP